MKLQEATGIWDNDTTAIPTIGEWRDKLFFSKAIFTSLDGAIHFLGLISLLIQWLHKLQKRVCM
jgi:hypothetical protein